MPDTRALELLGLIHDQLAFQEIKLEVVIRNDEIRLRMTKANACCDSGFFRHLVFMLRLFRIRCVALRVPKTDLLGRRRSTALRLDPVYLFVLSTSWHGLTG